MTTCYDTDCNLCGKNLSDVAYWVTMTDYANNVPVAVCGEHFQHDERGAVIVTECPDHGTVNAPDIASAAHYAGLAFSCVADILCSDYVSHWREHYPDSDCWVCCDRVKVLGQDMGSREPGHI